MTDGMLALTGTLLLVAGASLWGVAAHGFAQPEPSSTTMANQAKERPPVARVEGLMACSQNAES
jgi:hypothetical protein